MNKEKLYSIIIPVYNVERYLKRCLDSVMEQSYRNIEIILVDDGSNDSSGSMCDDYAKIDNRIIVVHKQNAGLGMARNTGIENSKGDYLLFVDSDDYISKDLIKDCDAELSRNQYDIVCFDYAEFENGRINYSNYSGVKSEFYDDDVVNIFLSEMIYNKENRKRYHDSAWNKLYSKELINRTNFRFVSEREFISEDYYSNLILFYGVKSVLNLPKVYYFYCYNGTSLTRSFDEKRFKKNIFQYNQSIRKCNELGYPNNIKKAIAFQTFGSFIGAMKQLVNNKKMSFKKKINEIKNVVNDPDCSTLFRDLDAKDENLQRKLLIKCFKLKMCLMIYLLFKLKS